MSDGAPIFFAWDGEAMRPSGKFWAKQADKEFVIGERYSMVEHHQRSQKTHAHYFASIQTAWANLPENMAERFPTSEHLRKYALIKAGYCDSQSLVCSSKAEALRLAEFVKPSDEFSIVTVNAQTVTRYSAKSQSTRAMGKEDFQRSKEAVLGILADMLAVPTAALRQAGEAA